MTTETTTVYTVRYQDVDGVVNTAVEKTERLTSATGWYDVLLHRGDVKKVWLTGQDRTVTYGPPAPVPGLEQAYSGELSDAAKANEDPR